MQNPPKGFLYVNVVPFAIVTVEPFPPVFRVASKSNMNP